ncbi:MAG TPA: FAD-dependent oxidoreductase [Rhizomicrobium sp.]|nr:FAD-dependent oxidoreductase [Rhizomicrobium sp.]
MNEHIVIVGAGQSGAQAVASLRSEGFTGAMTMIGDEPFPPYQRPPLSKAYLNGSMERERLFLKPDAFYADAKCELILGVGATHIDRARKVVVLADGREIAYDKLLIATGSRVRKIPVPGADLPGIFYLRGIADVDALREKFQSVKNLAIVGGGYIGLEVAAVGRKAGLEVTVFEAMDRVMARAVSKPISDFYEKVHRDAGVNLLLNTGVERFEGEGALQAIRAGGKSYAAEAALVGIGIGPNVELAKDAGLKCDDGIVVDNGAQTEDPNIFAAGDCTKHTGREGLQLRLECVQNAIDQAKHAALTMTGKSTNYQEVPWFWSDQYDLKLQIAGLIRPTDSIVLRGDPASRKFAAFHLRDGVVAAVESVNAAPEYLMGRKMIAERKAVDPATLADMSVSMKTIAS